MTTLSNAQIRQLWVNNGGSPALAPVMAAIADAESGGNTASVNNDPSTGDYSVGLWQINYFGSMLGPRSQRYGTPAQLQADPNAQAKAAIDLAAGGRGLSNWTTYTSGAYQQYLNGAPSMGGGNSAVGTLTSQAMPNGNAGAATDDHCIIGGGSLGSLPIIGSVGSTPCLLGTPMARAMLGAGIVTAGVAIGVFGVAVIVAGGLKGSPLARAAQPVAQWTVAGRSVGPRRRAEQSTALAEESGRQQAADPEFQAQRRRFASQGRRAERATPPPFTEADETLA